MGICSGYWSTEIWIELEFGNIGLEERRKPVYTHRKTSWSREDNQPQTQPTYGVKSGYRSLAT